MAQRRLDPIAEVGDPSGIPGTTFSSFSNVYVHPSGKVGVDAHITGAGVNIANDGGLWRGQAGAITPAAREGGPELFDSMTIAGLTAAPRLFFRSTENGTLEGGAYSTAGALATHGRAGFAAPGSAAQDFTGFGNFSANDLGSLSIFAKLTGIGTVDSAIYTNIGGPFLPVALESGPVSGIPAHTFLDINRGGYLVLNDLDYLLGGAAYLGPGHTGQRAGGIVLREPVGGTWSIIVNRRDPAPVMGGGAGILFDTFSSVNMNNSGEILFAAALVPAAPVTPATKDGVWHYNLGTLTPVARAGDAAPGLAAGVVFDTFEELFLSNTGIRVVAGRVRGPGITLANDRCAWADNGGGLALILQEGVTVLQGNTGGIAPGPVTNIETLTMDLAGNLVLQASVSGDRGIWSRKAAPASPWLPVLTPGECIQDGNYVNQKVLSVRASKFYGFNLPQGGGPVGRLRTFDGDKIALIVSHTGGSGAYFIVGAEIPLEALAIGGMEPPGVLGGRWLHIEADAVINLNDRAAFRGSMVSAPSPGPGGVVGSTDTGIWAQRADASIGLIAREGSLAPGAPAGALFNSFPHTPDFNENLQVVFHATMLQGTGGITANTDSGLWRGTEGALEMLAQEGVTDLLDLPAFIPISQFFGLPVMLSDGTVFVRAFLRAGTYPLRVGPGNTTVSSTNDVVILRFSSGTPSTISIVAREGTAAPGGGTFDEIESTSQLFASEVAGGTLAYKAKVNLPSKNPAVFVYNGGSSVRYGLQGDVAPSAGGALIDDPGHPILNDAGQLALTSSLQGGGLIISVGVYTGTLSTATLVARTGIPQSAGTFGPVGIDPAAEWSSLSFPALSDDGALAFRGDLTIGLGGVLAAKNTGIWRLKSSTLALITRAGDSPTDELGAVDAGPPFLATGFVVPRIGSLGRLGYSVSLTNGIIGWFTVDAVDIIRNMLYRSDALVVPNADTVTRNVNVKEIFYGNSHLIAPNGPSPFRVIGGLKTLVRTTFTDNVTSGLFSTDIPLGGGGGSCSCCAPPP